MDQQKNPARLTPAEQLLIDICKIVLPKDDEPEEDVDRMFQLHCVRLRLEADEELVLGLLK